MPTLVREPRMPQPEEIYKAMSKLTDTHEYIEQVVWHLEGLLDPRLTDGDKDVTYAEIGWLWELSEVLDLRAREIVAFADRIRTCMKTWNGHGLHAGDPSLESTS